MRLTLVSFMVSLCLEQLPVNMLPPRPVPLPQSMLPPRAPQPPTLPAGAVEYQSDGYTQSIFVLSGEHTVKKVPIRNLEAKWHQSGGMEGLTGWKSTKYRVIPEGEQVKNWVGVIQVLNSFGHYQPNMGLLREYPTGTEFHDVLSTEAGVFEHRVRKKTPEGWKSATIYFDKLKRPKGYNGLKVTCASCHDGEKPPGSGGYGTGLVPGGDTVISDPLPWHLANYR